MCSPTCKLRSDGRTAGPHLPRAMPARTDASPHTRQASTKKSHNIVSCNAKPPGCPGCGAETKQFCACARHSWAHTDQAMLSVYTRRQARQRETRPFFTTQRADTPRASLSTKGIFPCPQPLPLATRATGWARAANKPSLGKVLQGCPPPCTAVQRVASRSSKQDCSQGRRHLIRQGVSRNARCKPSAAHRSCGGRTRRMID